MPFEVNHNIYFPALKVLNKFIVINKNAINDVVLTNALDIFRQKKWNKVNYKMTQIFEIIKFILCNCSLRPLIRAVEMMNV